MARPGSKTMNASPPSPGSLSLAFVEELFRRFLEEPTSVDPSWRAYFEAELAGSPSGAAPPRVGPATPPRSLFDPAPPQGGASEVSEAVALQDRVDQLIRAYRVRGHLIARVDPLGRPHALPLVGQAKTAPPDTPPRQPELEPDFYGLTETDLDRTVSSRTIAGTSGRHTIRQILERLRNTYCRSIGVQFMHIDNLAVKNWLQARMEATENRLHLDRATQHRILQKLTDAVIFEEFIQKKYIGAKRFSLEGSESLIPLLDLTIEKAGEDGLDEIVLAMAHRGRLNVLANIMGKSPSKIFAEFEDRDFELYIGRGDVKYHLGWSYDRPTASGRPVHLSLCFNPSHLEFVSPVSLGRVRAKQDVRGDARREKVLGVVIHGDAAFAGQGVVQEVFNLSEVDAYRTGGTIHVIVNNQIGFTTCPDEGRSSLYATDVARMLQIPIFHVNGEDPEAVAQVVRLAMDFRRTFRKDVVIDMYGYRRHGHNEGDEPAFTQPAMYKAIRARKSVREGYLEHLLKLGDITREEADALAWARREELNEELSTARRFDFHVAPDDGQGRWSAYSGGFERDLPEAETAIDPDRFQRLMAAMTRLPEGFQPHPKIQRFLDRRKKMAAGELPLDWATAEALALASLAEEGHRVRFAGQDTGRGTFSQRNAILHDVRGNGTKWIPLQHLTDDQAPVEIVNSPLSEVGVLGYEYGYSLDMPDGLTIWEAQFGDFCNVAQVLIDQFISSAEDKWRRLSGLVMLLPHGFEGQGPEHSSARLERFLSLAAEENIQVVNASTPAQYFHLLRRQILRRWRKPLIVMSPKSLLRHPRCVSPIEEITSGRFRRVLPDTGAGPTDQVRRVLLCSGKIYYELLEHREKLGRQDVAILRLEQLYPLRLERIDEVLAVYPDQVGVLWIQEEPENMGAWRYLKAIFGHRMLDRHPFTGIYRQASASPATGSARSHRIEQNAVLDLAFAGM